MRRLEEEPARFFVLSSPLPTKTINKMVINNTGGLHPRVYDYRADKLEAALFQCNRDLFGKRSLRWNRPCTFPRVSDRFAAGHGPDESGEILARCLHGEIGTSTADRSLDLGAGPDDARISEHSH